MTQQLKIYDLQRVKIVVAGIPIQGGFSDGDVITLELSSPTFTTKIGADGDVTRSKTYNGHAKVTLALMQSSSANALLSAIHNLDRLSDNGAGVGPLMITDLGGATLWTASKSWIAEPPKSVFAREASAREWGVETADLTFFEGGN